MYELIKRFKIYITAGHVVGFLVDFVANPAGCLVVVGLVVVGLVVADLVVADRIVAVDRHIVAGPVDLAAESANKSTKRQTHEEQCQNSACT